MNRFKWLIILELGTIVILWSCMLVFIYIEFKDEYKYLEAHYDEVKKCR
ncbi:hypothetical protein [Haloplasma contractile]|uniref:Uncharacterized protein n=1 Tax=Haloplasma contractile SSD-17B TaxID=1033810 RepID=U2FKP6_9MOLU|nr:hypothetical protein [Haloplasma contractile]ERJ11794.1 hypothetical protein HLPCO_002033 [Haloplasma contractile SSD-17B]